MKRIILLGVGLSTFLCGSLLARLYFGYADPVAPAAISPAPDVKIQVERKSLLEGISATGRGCGNGYAQGYELPDGKELGEGNSCYSSFKAADREMRDWLKQSDVVIERVAPPKQKGMRKSERVVASFSADESGDKWVRIMWVHGQCIRWISAPDLEHALELERGEYNPYKFEE